MRFYHAAPKETMMKIYAEGVLKKSWDGVVYMCKDPIDACKFLVIRGMRQMSVIELELDEKEVEESHDNSETFFKCKAYINTETLFSPETREYSTMILSKEKGHPLRADVRCKSCQT